MTATEEPPGFEYVRTIYEAARDVSRETRGEVVGALTGFNVIDPAERWGDILRRRAESGVSECVRKAGGCVVRLAGTGGRSRAVRHAVKKLLAAVGELADFQPGFEPIELPFPGSLAAEWGLGPDATFTDYRPAPEGVARLDDLRQRVLLCLVELEELLRGHPDPHSQVLAINRRLGVKLVPTAEMADAVRVGRWFERLEQDAG